MNVKVGLVIISLILMNTIVYSAAGCWEAIRCANSGAISDGDIIFPDYMNGLEHPELMQEMCTLRNIALPNNVPIEIEIVSGGHKDADRDLRWIITSDILSINPEPTFYLSRYTSPVYINCYQIDTGTLSNGEDYHRQYTLQTFVVAYGLDYFDYEYSINQGLGEPVYSDNYADSRFDVNFGSYIKTHENLPADRSNPFIMGLGYLLLAFGIFLSFTFVFQLFKRR